MPRKPRPATQVGPAGLLPLILFLLAASPVAAQPALKARQDFLVGRHPVDLLAADYDSDGRLDLITVDQLSNTVGLTKGFGDGTFRQVATVTVGLTPTGVKYADVNNDGIPDLITSNFLTQGVTVNLGNGQGGFAAKLRTGVLTTPFGVVVGHWDGDGNLDAATVNSTQNTLSILHGQGNGLFGPVTQILVGDEPRHMVTDDFNGDGNADLAVVHKVSQEVQIWHGDGAGQFTLGLTIPTGSGSGPVYLAIGDFDAINGPDLVVCNEDGDEVNVYLADGLGGFGSTVTLTPGAGPQAATAADMNGDGDLDLLVVMSQVSGVGELALLHGDGAGGFAAPILTNTGPIPTSVTTGDFNGDGALDVVTANLTGNTISFLETSGPSAFIEADKIELDVETFPFGLEVADLNNDTKADVATANLGSDDVTYALGDGLGGFGGPVAVSTGNLSGPEDLVAVDWDGDGNIDIATVNTGTDTMSLLQNNGSANPSNLFNASNGQPIGVCQSPVAITAGEVSGDLHPDLAFVCDVSHDYCTRLGTGGSGTAAFGPTNCTALFEPVPGGVALGQFNFDALEDAAITSKEVDIVAFANADGSGGVTDVPSTFPVGTDPIGVVRGDVNGDGFDDVVVTNSLSASISTLLGDGGGAFSFPAIDSPAGEGPFDVALADFNQDGKLDAAVSNGNANNVSLLLGDGFGHFSKAGDFGVRNLPLGIETADFNKDGWPDLAVTDHFADSVTVLLNQSTITDPLQMVTIFDNQPTVFRWGLVPGALYDVIRGEVGSVVPEAGFIDLGPVLCLADDLDVPDLVGAPDAELPAVGQAFFYFIRPVIDGLPGSYGTASDGRPRLTSAGCF